MTMVNIDINIKNIENSMFSETPGFIRQLQEAKLTLFTFPYWTLTQTPFWEQKRSSPPFSQEIPPTQVQAKKDQHSRYHQYRTQEAEIRTNLTGRATFDGENCKCRNPCPFPTVLPHNPNRFLVPKSKTMTISEFWGSKNARIQCRMPFRNRMRDRKVVKSTFWNEFW